MPFLLEVFKTNIGTKAVKSTLQSKCREQMRKRFSEGDDIER